MKNIIIGVVLSSVFLLGLGWLLVGQEKPAQTHDMAISPTDHQSNASASATLVEYSDFQCPACGAYQELVTKLKADLGDKVNVVYRNFPLRQIHKNAQFAAQVAEAAALQGKFWEMHDLLFTNQAAWSELPDPNQTFAGYASQLNLDMPKFTKDLNSAEVKAKIDQDYASGNKYGVNATPSFYLNGVKLTNPASYETFKEIVSAKL